MLLRRTTPLAIAVAALACEPSVPFNLTNNPAKIDYAAFDPTGSPPDIPLPNDLAFQPQAIASQPAAQAALLTQWVAQGGFPNDQEVPVTVDFVTVTIDPNTGAQTRSAPALDTTSINGSNILVLSLSTSGSGAVAYDTPKASDYQVNGDHGTLTIHKSPDPSTGSRRWPAGAEMVVAVRGGANGVKVTNGAPGGLQPQAAMFLLEQDKDLTLPENQPLLPGATRAQKAATGAQLETLRKGYLLPFAAVDGSGVFTHRDIATMGTFKIADTAKRTHVETDPSAGELPLPSDFLFDATGHLSPVAQAAFNKQAAGLGTGLGTLDGFSTTAMILSQTSTAITANSVAGGVFVYEVNLAATPPFRRLQEITEAVVGGTPATAEYAAEPSAITKDALGGSACASVPYGASCLSTAIGLQPAVPAAIPIAPGIATLPPLKEGTTYVVLVTDKVKDLNGDPLVRSTLGQILLLDPSLTIAVNGHSTVAGVDDPTAAALDQMRGAINGAAQVLAAEKPTLTRDHIVMGYTFHTQTMKTTAVKLTALPYATPSSGANSTINAVSEKLFGVCAGLGGACPDGAVTDVFDNYGVDRCGPGASCATGVVPHSNIFAIVEAKIVTFNALDPGTGAFIDLTNPANQPAAEIITALIAVPPPTCATPPCSVPLAIYRHGINDGRGDMLTVADSLLAQGIAVAAIDMAKPGERSFCAKDSECAGGTTCQRIAAMAGQGDPAGAGPGRCCASGDTACIGGATAQNFVRSNVLCQTGDACATATPSEGRPIASGNFLVSANFFRIRDTFRQDLIDESQLIRVFSPNPFCDKTKPPTDPNTCANNIITAKTGIQIDPGKIWWVSQSLGSMNGTVDVAANPRISKAGFSVGGGTTADVYTNSPSFAVEVNTLLTSLGVAPGTAGYLQLINVAKWILDPADPLNFAVNLSAQTLPSPLSNNTAPPARKILGQASNCDLTVPNPFNLELAGLSGLGPVSATASTFQLFVRINTGTGAGNYSSIGQTKCQVSTPAGPVAVPEAHAGGGSVPHGIITNWGCLNAPGSPTCSIDPNLNTLTGQAQADIAAFLASDTLPPPSRNAP